MASKGKKKFVKPKEPTKKDLANRIEKKKKAINTLVKDIRKVRLNYRKDMHSDDEKLALTAMAVAIMDKTAERIGNEGSAGDGHFGVTGFQCRHIKQIGKRNVSKNWVCLEFIGKSGVCQSKTFTDPDVAKIMRSRIKRCKKKTEPVLQTSDGFKIKADKVNRYLARFGITAKDIRGYQANRLMADELKCYKGQLKGEKERKTVFMRSLRKVAGKVGHTAATLRKHYLLSHLEPNYLNRGQIPSFKR